MNNCIAKFVCIDREDMNCEFYIKGEKYRCKNSFGDYCTSGRANVNAVDVAKEQRVIIK